MWLVVFVYSGLAPRLDLRILPSWSDESKQFLILKFQIENKSRIRIRRGQIRVQILEYRAHETTFLSEWVPFDEEAIVPTEQPVEWREPVEIFQRLRRIDPGETISVERLYRCPSNRVLHIGLQVRITPSLLGRIADRIRTRTQQWTTTCIAAKPNRDTTDT